MYSVKLSRPDHTSTNHQLIEQQLRRPDRTTPPQRHIPRRWRWLLSAILCALLIGALAFIYQMSSPPSMDRFSNAQTTQAEGQAEHLTSQFMDAMLQKNWTTMWSLLHPDAQQSWQGERDFMHFEQAKFGSIDLLTYTMGAAHLQRSWRNPNTTLLYPSAVLLKVSLQATTPRGRLSAPSALELSEGLFYNMPFAFVEHYGQWQVLVAGPADLEAPILVPASATPVTLSVPIFMYHHISHLPTSNLLDYNLTVTTANFAAQLNWLQQHDYHSITQTELFDAFYYGKALPPHPMILTFDDGYEDMYTDALPLLLAHHYRGVFYIITGLIGRGYMTWEQIHILFQDGMQISSHSVNHINIGEPPRWTSTQAELQPSMQTLEEQLGTPIQFFCYPSGEPFHHDTVAEQQLVLADLFNDGYVGATLDPFSFTSTMQKTLTPYQLNRIRVSGGESLDSFVGILSTALRATN